ncbi:MAG: glycosyltransferase family 2 protein [Candidatus Zixiibacteriota bacterium]
MKTFNRDKVLVVVPAYNAAQHLPELIARCRRILGDNDLLFVNDGSTDASLDILKREGVSYITYLDNRGKGAALQTAFAYALEQDYRSVLTLDADLQHPPEEIPDFIRADNGRTVLVGTRRMNLKIMPFGRWLSNNLTSIIVSVFSSARVRDSQSGFRLIPVEALRLVPLKCVGYDFESELLFKIGALGYPVSEVPISTIYDGSRSFINPYKDTLRFIRQIWKRIWF